MESIITRNADRLLRTAVAILRNRGDAEDAVQDVFVTLYERQTEFTSEAHETAWLLRVTINLCRSRLRSPWRRRVPLLETHPAPDDEARGLIAAVLALPAKYRTVIHLHYYEGYTTAEIAEITQTRESAVRQQLTRARRKLKLELEGEYA